VARRVRSAVNIGAAESTQVGRSTEAAGSIEAAHTFRSHYLPGR
jgi:hypothetical protein